MNAEVTLLGLALLPLWPFMLVLSAPACIAILVLVSPLHAGSVLDLSLGPAAFGFVAPTIATGIYILRKSIKILARGSIVYDKQILLAYQPVIIFLALAVMSAAVLPTVFRGETLIFNARLTEDRAFVLLEPSTKNITQCLYLTLTVAVAVAISHGVLFYRNMLLYVTRAYFATGAIAIFFGLYEFAAFYLGLEYPYEFFVHKPDRPEYVGQAVHGVKRLSSVFSEPGALAHYFVGFFAFCTYYYFNVRRSFHAGVLSVASAFVIILSGSTMGYAVLTLAGIYIAYRTMRKIVLNRPFTQQSVAWAAGVVILIPIAIGAAAAFDLWDRIFIIMETMIVKKHLGGSFLERLAWDLNALDVFANTFGLGAGWGSNFASSVILTIASNTGIWGLSVLVWFFFRLRRRYRQVRRFRCAEFHPMSAFMWAAIAMFVAASMSGVDLNNFSFWTNLAMFVGLLVRQLHTIEWNDPAYNEP